MCNCIEELIKGITEKHKEWDGKKVEHFSFQGTHLSLESGETFYALPIAIKVAGQKKLKETFVKFSYCPLCGEKYP